MNNGEIPAPSQDQGEQTQFPTGADSWLGKESGLPKPSFPEVGKIPKAAFDILVNSGKGGTGGKADFGATGALIFVDCSEDMVETGRIEWVNGRIITQGEVIIQAGCDGSGTSSLS